MANKQLLPAEKMDFNVSGTIEVYFFNKEILYRMMEVDMSLAYQTKSLPVTAICHTGFNYQEIREFCRYVVDIDANTSDIMIIANGVKTLVAVGDFIIRDSNDQLQRADADTFWKTYERPKTVVKSTMDKDERNRLTKYGVVWNTDDPEFEPDDADSVLIQKYHKGLGFPHWYVPDGALCYACFETEQQAFDALKAWYYIQVAEHDPDA